MREIKFRAWVIPHEWQKEEGKKPYMTYDIQNTYDSGEEGEGSFSSYLINPERYKVMQYIGRKDKNGREIYEGDIVCLTTEVIAGIGPIHHTGEVEYHTPYAGFGLHGIGFDRLSLFPIEVIGNIYENPELLKL